MLYFFKSLVDHIVAITAFISCDRTISARAVVRYDDVVINWGRAYRSTTGMFTASYHGLYRFCCILVGLLSNSVHLEMVKNRKRESTLYSASQTFSQSSQTLNLDLDKGDNISMQNHNHIKAMLHDHLDIMFSPVP